MNGDNFDSPEGSANARLIASAPDMLSALQTALACLENLQKVQIWEEDQGDHITEALEAKYEIQAAINKATNQWNPSYASGTQSGWTTMLTVWMNLTRSLKTTSTTTNATSTTAANTTNWSHERDRTYSTKLDCKWVREKDLSKWWFVGVFSVSRPRRRLSLRRRKESFSPENGTPTSITSLANLKDFKEQHREADLFLIP